LLAACDGSSHNSVLVHSTNIPTTANALEVGVTIDSYEDIYTFDNIEADLADGDSTFAIAIPKDIEGQLQLLVRALAGECAVAEVVVECAVPDCENLDAPLEQISPADCGDDPDAGPDANNGRTPDASQ
jgi:hypothetical protein